MAVTGKPWRVVLAAKLLLALAAAGGLFGTLDQGTFRSALANWPPGGKATLSSRFASWDAAHYLRLSKDGYTAGSMSCAFYPLWPMVLRPATAVAGNSPLMAAMVLANALSLIGLCLFYRLVERRYGPGVGRDSLILMLAFPGALFFSFPYSESFYFVLVMAFFWGLELRQPALTGLAGFLLPLARPVGVFVLLPLAWRLYEERGRQNQLQPSECKPTNRSLMAWLLLACPLLGYAAYFGLMRLWTGNALEGFDAQRSYPNSPSIQNLFNYAGFFRALSNVQTLGGMMHSMLDRFFFVLFLALLPLIYRLDKTWFFYVLPAGLVPALSSWFMSYRRYIVVLFPLFVVLAQLLARTRQRWIFWYYVALLALLQVWAVRQFVSFDWAG
ncbi:MAG TPA: hypothetical protein VG146_18885 [Verrucomicrobiae bacterium]|nr:hypothetical protein [Verrucomicrobiae bacterium]